MHQTITRLAGRYASVLAALLLAACSAVEPAADTGRADDVRRKLPEPVPTCCINPRVPDPLDDTASILSRRSIYFDLDGYLVQDEFKAILEAHGRYLAIHPERRLRLTGNTDERGSREYNLALGQSRAEAVRRVLEIYGAQSVQMESVSYGKEMPKASGHDEAAWAENRRVDLLYLP